MNPFIRILGSVLLSLLFFRAAGQCAADKNQATLNWDYLDYFRYTGSYSTGYLTSLAQAQTQHFAFGTQRLTITNNYTAANIIGDTTAHTGEQGSFASGADIQFEGNGTITLTFEQEVENLRFSIYDIDLSQSVQFKALNAANVALNVSLSTVAVSATTPLASILTLGGNNSTAAYAQASGTTTGLASYTGTVNVTVAGPVKSITLTITNSQTGDDSFWISDISACSAGSFPMNYYAVSRPFTGQPGYVLHAYDESIFATNPDNGETKLLFTDAAGLGNINSMAYDPYNRILYYVYSLTSTGNARVLKKYDFNTRTISTVVADINTLGIPTAGSGSESGAAAFYNGSLFLGIETSNSSRNTFREAVIYRIDFNSANIPYRASQVFALNIDGTRLMHDWSDFGINDGILYDFDGAITGSVLENDVYHFDMMTGATSNWHNPAGYTPGQVAVDWKGTIYNVHASGTAVKPYIAAYNGDGTIGTRFNIPYTTFGYTSVPSLGDAAEAFRPRADFGDAPASYDPDPWSPALHEVTAGLRLGAITDDEWNKTSSVDANADGGDEDGVATVNIFRSSTGAYQLYVNVFNNTGAAATVVAWLDFNRDGVFQAYEGVSKTVNSMNGTQSVNLAWTGINAPLPEYAYSYLRVRVTSAVNGMSTESSTGYFPNGEVEDYYVLINQYPLETQLTDFTARKAGEKVDLQWKVADEKQGTGYQLERSTDGRMWSVITQQQATADNSTNGYYFTDLNPAATSYYRLQYRTADGMDKYSTIHKIVFTQQEPVRLFPNPAFGEVTLQLWSVGRDMASVQIIDVSGKMVYARPFTLETGTNTLKLPLRQLPAGVYTVRCMATKNQYAEKLVVRMK